MRLASILSLLATGLIMQQYLKTYVRFIISLPFILVALLHDACQTLSISWHVSLSGHIDVALFE